MKLFVWEGGTGELNLIQQGGFSDTLVSGYEEMGKRAGYFDARDNIGFDDVYMHMDKLAERPRLLLRVDRHKVRANGMDEVKVVGIPAGARVTIFDGVEQEMYVSDGTTFHMTFAMPAIYYIKVECHPYRDARFQIEAAE